MLISARKCTKNLQNNVTFKFVRYRKYETYFCLENQQNMSFDGEVFKLVHTTTVQWGTLNVIIIVVVFKLQECTNF